MSENSMSSTIISRANIAVNRFGYGARGDELTQAEKDPRQWLESQLKPITFNGDFPHSNTILIEHAKYQKEKKRQKKQQKINSQSGNMQANSMQANMQSGNMKDQKKPKNFSRQALRNMSVGTLKQAIASSNSVSWRLLDFFSNHFSVTAHGQLMVGLAATLEREAIAPHLLGNFEDMLLAVEQHPGMLIYLNNEKSFGPNSRMAKKRNKGLNENLAREIMELHTLGIDGGYSQEDVIELAKGITGWSVKRPGKERGEGFVFRAYGHEPGSRKLLGKIYSQLGIAQGQQMLRDLAMNPATAKHLCHKLAHHFACHNPPASLLKKMEATWLKTHGNIKAVMHCLFDADEAWFKSAQKYKTPREFVISTLRALSLKRFKDNALLSTLINLGQQPFNAGSPAGYSDYEQDWLGASALMARIDWATMVSGYSKRANAEKVMKLSIGTSVSQLTYNSVMRAESRQQALTLLLMSPEFQRR
ncbi:MAG: DUF1800 domain-containing protein [Colwellia sp.]|nr:DUF1800 domain-containing protein [Colwellia sp.]